MNLKYYAYSAAGIMSDFVSRILNGIHIGGTKEESMERLHKVYPVREVNFKNKLEAENEYDLSLLIPVYNSEKYIGKCLDSLVNQKTNFRYEIVLVNDGSTDGTAQIIEGYLKMHNNIRLYSQPNAGTSAARNRAVQLAKGKYIGFIDNDDFVEPTYVELLLSRAYATDADVVRCGHKRFDVTKNKVLSVKTYGNEDKIFDGDIGSAILNLSGFVWEGISRRSLWDDIAFPEGYWYEDIICHLVLMRKANRIICLKEALYYYNIHQTNAFRTVWKNDDIKCLDQLYLVDMLMNKYRHLGKENMLAYTVIHECGEVLWLRVRGMEQNIQKDIFIAASGLALASGGGYDGKGAYENRMLDIMKKKSFYAWQMLCCSRMLKSKRRNETGR